MRSWRQPLKQQSPIGASPKLAALPSSLRHFGGFSGGPSRRRLRFAGHFFGCRSRPARGASFIFTPIVNLHFGLSRPRPCRSAFLLILPARIGSRFFSLRVLRGFRGRTVGGPADGAGRCAGPRQDQDRHAPRLHRGDGLSPQRRAFPFAGSFRRRACAGTNAVPGSPDDAPDAAFRGRHLRAPKG